MIIQITLLFLVILFGVLLIVSIINNTIKAIGAMIHFYNHIDKSTPFFAIMFALVLSVYLVCF